MTNLITYDVTLTESRIYPRQYSSETANELKRAYFRMYEPSTYAIPSMCDLGAGLELLRDAYTIADDIAEDVNNLLTPQQMKEEPFHLFARNVDRMRNASADLFRNSLYMLGGIHESDRHQRVGYLNNAQLLQLMPGIYERRDINDLRRTAFTDGHKTDFAFSLFTMSHWLEDGAFSERTLQRHADQYAEDASLIIEHLADSCEAGTAVILGGLYLYNTIENAQRLDYYYDITQNANQAGRVFTLAADLLRSCNVTAEEYHAEPSREDPDQLADVLAECSPKAVKMATDFYAKHGKADAWTDTQQIHNEMEDLLRDLITIEDVDEWESLNALPF